MEARLIVRFAISAVLAAFGQGIGHVRPGNSSFSTPETVEIANGSVRLKAYLWTPEGTESFPAVLFNHGSGGEDPAHTAGMPITEAAERLAPVFVKRGYAFLYVFRRGQGLSADQAPFMQDLLKQEEAAHGKGARQRLQDKTLFEEHLSDVLAALKYLKTVAGVDGERIAVVGHSYGGQLTLMAAGKDPTVRAAVSFAGAANSWARSPSLRKQLLEAMGETHGAVMLVQAENDYDTAPSRELTAELERLHKPHILKIYPPVGTRKEDGHNFLYLAMPAWQDDVFQFLGQHLRKDDN